MNRTTAILAALALAHAANAQFPAVNVGSDGSYGALEITENTTLDLPADGIIHATNVSVADGATLSFNRNPANTPVYILSQGDINIAGTISVSATGRTSGPGGFDGTLPASDGYGPAGGVHPVGSTFIDAGSTADYVSPLLIPLVGGSGGSGSPTVIGGGGGGALLLASDTKLELQSTAKITAQGLTPFDNRTRQIGGAGGDGCVRLAAPEITHNGDGGTILANSNTGYIRFDSFAYTGNDFFPLAHSYGTNFVIFPTNAPTLEIIELAGVPVDQTNPIALVTPPTNIDPNTTVKIRATDFRKVVPISIVIQPASGPRTKIDTIIDNQANNPATQTFNITLPLNTTSRIYVWSRKAN